MLDSINKMDLPPMVGDTNEEEALIRLRDLGVSDNIIKQYEDISKPMAERLTMSDEMGNPVALDEEALSYLPEVMKEFGVPYHCVKAYLDAVPLYAFLYVSRYSEEWEYERIDKTSGVITAYVNSIYCQGCPDLGSIVVKRTAGGGVRRVG